MAVFHSKILQVKEKKQLCTEQQTRRIETVGRAPLETESILMDKDDIYPFPIFRLHFTCPVHSHKGDLDESG